MPSDWCAAQCYVHDHTLLTHYSFKVTGLLNIFSRSWNYPLQFFFPQPSGTHSFSSLSETILNCDILYKHELDAKPPWTKSFVCFTFSFHSMDTQKSNKSQNLILHGLPSKKRNALWHFLLTPFAVKCSSKPTNWDWCTNIKVKKASQ